LGQKVGYRGPKHLQHGNNGTTERPRGRLKKVTAERGVTAEMKKIQQVLGYRAVTVTLKLSM